MGVLHSFSIKNTFYDKMDLRLFYFDVAKYATYWKEATKKQMNNSEKNWTYNWTYKRPNL